MLPNLCVQLDCLRSKFEAEFKYDIYAIEKLHCKMDTYRQTCKISRTLVGNKIVDHSDVVGAAPVGILDLTTGFNILHKTRQDEKHFYFGIWYSLY